MINRKIAVVVYPAPANRKETRFGYSVECLTFATMLEQNGFDVRYFDFSISPIDEATFIHFLGKLFPSRLFIYFDSVPLHRSSNVTNALSLCKTVKTVCPDCAVVACGPWCMLNRERVPFADDTWTDEPELCLMECLAGRFCHSFSAKPRLLNSIESLPRPNRRLLSEIHKLEMRSFLAPSAVMQTSRGCRMRCRFCPRQAWNNQIIRHRKISDCVSELTSLTSTGIRNIWIDDDNMGGDQEWACAFFDSVSNSLGEMRKEYGLYLSSDVNVSDRFFKKAHSAGVRIVSFGIESGSQKVLDYYWKPSSPEKIKAAVTAADRAGLFVVGNFIVGAPEENEEDHQSTRHLLELLPFDEINVKILSIVQGAPLWREMVSDGRMSIKCRCEFANSSNGTSSIPFAELKRRQQELYTAFRDNPRRKERMMRKIEEHGPPYFVTDSTVVSRSSRIGDKSYERTIFN